VLDRKVHDFSYILSKDNIADSLTKYKAETQGFENIIKHSHYDKLSSSTNANNDHIKK
jgi:hypothetical protein